MKRMRKLAAYWLLWSSWSWEEAASYPTRAGSCYEGKPAVGDLHLSYGDGSRHVRSGDLRDSHLQLFVDGTDLTTASGDDVTLDVGEYYVIEIVAKSRPYKGALLRAESNAPMTLVPLINAGVESECESSIEVQGVSHVDNTPKNAFSAGLTVHEEGGVAFDVTVVEYNNATGSVFWYSHFKLRAANNVNDLDIDGEQCFVCGSEKAEISERDQVVMLSGLAITCDEMYALGLRAEIPIEKCTEATALATASCGCTPQFNTPSAAINTPSPTFAEKCYVCGTKEAVVGTPSQEVFFDNKVATCNDLHQDGLKVCAFSRASHSYSPHTFTKGMIPPFNCAKAQSAANQVCHCEAHPDSAGTYEPTVTPLPTYSEPCFVCGQASRYTTSSAMVQVDDIAVSCLDLLQDGLTGYIPPDLCPRAQKVALQHCECTATSTLSPTVTASPTSTPYPTFANKCFVCGTGKEVTNEAQVIVLDGVRGTCRSLQDEGLAGYISSQVCDKAQLVAEVSCGCSLVADQTHNTPCPLCQIAPWTITNLDTEIVVSGDRGTCEELDSVVRSNLLPDEFCAEAQAVARSSCGCTAPTDTSQTFQPTLTPAPTMTASPSYTNPCHVCGNGQQITETNALVTLDGLQITCEELEEAGKERLIPPSFCTDAQVQASSYCKCSAPSPSLSTLVPTNTPFPTATYTPTFSSACNLCQAGEFVTRRDTLVTLDNLVLSCQELDEAATERMISPSLCPLARQQAQSACGCKKPALLEGDAPALSPIRTFHPTITMQPTITAMPTYKSDCNVCGSSSKQVFEPNTIVEVADIRLTCRDLEEAGKEASIPPTICPQAQSVAEENCMCGAVTMTFSPTISPAPTLTPAPSHHRHCQVCSTGWSISKRGELVMMAGYALTCEELEAFGATGHLPPDLCFEAKEQAARNCMCLPNALEKDEVSVGRLSFGSSGQRRSMPVTSCSISVLSVMLLLLAWR